MVEKQVSVVISTSHIPPDELGFVEEYASMVSEYGYLFFVDHDDLKASPSFVAILKWAKRQGADFVWFDCDGEIIPELQTFEMN